MSGLAQGDGLDPRPPHHALSLASLLVPGAASHVYVGAVVMCACVCVGA